MRAISGRRLHECFGRLCSSWSTSYRLCEKFLRKLLHFFTIILERVSIKIIRRVNWMRTVSIDSKKRIDIVISPEKEKAVWQNASRPKNLIGTQDS